MSSFRIGGGNLKATLWLAVLVAATLVTAVLSFSVRRSGQFRLAAYLSVVALVLAGIGYLVLLTRVLSRSRFLGSLVSFRITRRGAFVLSIGLVIALSVFNTGNNLLILILSVLLASLVASLVTAGISLQNLKISVNLPNAIHAGQKAMFFVTIQNMKRLFPSFGLTLRGKPLKAPDGEGAGALFQESVFAHVAPGDRLKLAMHCEFPQRGVYPVEGFEVETCFPFGFLKRRKELEAHGQIIVYPAVRDITSLLLRHPALIGTAESNWKGWGTSLYNIRDYQAGDDARFVHWKSTAKVSRLMVKDFALEVHPPLNLVFSTWLPDRSAVGLEAFEKGVSLVASLISYYISNRQRFSFDTGEFRAEVDEANCEERYESVMEYLATLEPAPQNWIDPESLAPRSVLFAASKPSRRDDIVMIDYLML